MKKASNTDNLFLKLYKVVHRRILDRNDAIWSYLQRRQLTFPRPSITVQPYHVSSSLLNTARRLSNDYFHMQRRLTAYTAPRITNNPIFNNLIIQINAYMRRYIGNLYDNVSDNILDRFHRVQFEPNDVGTRFYTRFMELFNSLNTFLFGQVPAIQAPISDTTASNLDNIEDTITNRAPISNTVSMGDLIVDIRTYMLRYYNVTFDSNEDLLNRFRNIEFEPDQIGTPEEIVFTRLFNNLNVLSYIETSTTTTNTTNTTNTNTTTTSTITRTSNIHNNFDFDPEDLNSNNSNTVTKPQNTTTTSTFNQNNNYNDDNTTYLLYLIKHNIELNDEQKIILKKYTKDLLDNLKEDESKYVITDLSQNEKELLIFISTYLEHFSPAANVPVTISREQEEFLRLYTNNTSNNFRHLEPFTLTEENLLKSYLISNIPDTCFFLDQYEAKLTALRNASIIYETMGDRLSDAALLEILRRTGIISNHDVNYHNKKHNDHANVKQGEGIKLSGDVFTTIKNNPRLFPRVNIDRTPDMDAILKLISKKEIFFGIIDRNLDNNALLLTGEDLHYVIVVEDPEDNESYLILAILTSTKNGTIWLSKSQNLNI